MKYLTLLVFTLIAIFLTACQPDPRKQAEADALTLTSQQQAADAEQARQIALANEIYWQQRREAAAAKFDLMVSNALHFASFVIIIVVVAVGVTMAVTFRDTARGIGAAVVRAAEVRANVLSLDPAKINMAYFYLSNGKYIAHNLNTSEVRLLDTQHEASRLEVLAAARTHAIGTIVHAARVTVPDNAKAITTIELPAIETEAVQ